MIDNRVMQRPRPMVDPPPITETFGKVKKWAVGIQTEVTALWDSLEVMLTNKNILVDGDINASTETPLELTADEAGAVMNLLYIDEDASIGVHNPGYVRALLKNSIQAMSSK